MSSSYDQLVNRLPPHSQALIDFAQDLTLRILTKYVIISVVLDILCFEITGFALIRGFVREFFYYKIMFEQH